MSCVHMSIRDFPQIMSSSSILKSPGGSRAGKQAGKHLGGIQLEPCPIGAFYLITWRLEPRWMRHGEAGT